MILLETPEYFVVIFKVISNKYFLQVTYSSYLSFHRINIYICNRHSSFVFRLFDVILLSLCVLLTFWLRGPLRALFAARNNLAAPVKLLCYTMLLYFEDVQAVKYLSSWRQGLLLLTIFSCFSLGPVSETLRGQCIGFVAVCGLFCFWKCFMSMYE